MARKSRKANNLLEQQQEKIRVYKVAIYVRLSVEDIRKKISDSIGTQKAMIIQYMQAQPDMELYEIYEDVNYTGTNYNRPGFTKMFEDIQAGLVDCVIVKDLSRFGRNFEETGNLLERVFPSLQVRFISIGDNYDSLTASIDESSLIVPLKNLMNEVYARDISKKVQSSIKMKQKRGEYCGGLAPYGYIKDGKSFVIDQEATAVVRQIFKWILDGFSDYAIVSKLNELKITPPSRYRFEKGITKAKKHGETKFWYKSAIKRISENMAYIGVLAQGKQQSNFLKGGTYEFKNRDEWIIIENTHQAIIDKETFEAVRRIRDSRKENHKPGIVTRENIYKGLIFCANCGAHMTRDKLYRVDSNDVYYYSCNTYRQVDKHACTKKKIMGADLSETLFWIIKNQISLTVDISRIIYDLQKQASFCQRYNVLDNRIESLQKKLQQNRHFRGTLRENFKDGIISEQDYTAMKSDYDEEAETLRQELETVLSEKLRTDNTFSLENKWIVEFKKFEKERHISSQLISTLIERIYVSDNMKIDVVLRYRDECQALKDYNESTEQAPHEVSGDPKGRFCKAKMQKGGRVTNE